MSVLQVVLMTLVGGWAVALSVLAAGAIAWLLIQRLRTRSAAAQGEGQGGGAPLVQRDEAAGPPRHFTGRSRELMRLEQHFGEGVIIRSPGGEGSGKTALARALVQRLAGEYEGCLEIDLGGDREKNALSVQQAMRRLLWAIHPQMKMPDSAYELEELYRDTLRKYKILLLLDNARSTAHARPLLPPKPSAAVVTLQSPQAGEDVGLKVFRLGSLQKDEAIRLLKAHVERLKNDPPAELAALVGQCGCLPLAVNLAGGLLKYNSSWEPLRLADRIVRERMRLGWLPESQKSGHELEAILNIAGESLGSLLESHFHALGIFEGPFSLAAAAYVWGCDRHAAGRDMHSLLSHHLVEWQETSRLYSLHPVVGGYILETLLSKPDEARRAQLRHATYYQKQLELLLEGHQDGAPLAASDFRRLLELVPQWLSALRRMQGGGIRWPRLPESDAWISIAPEKIGELLPEALPEDEWRRIFDLALEASRRLNDRVQEARLHLKLGRLYRLRQETGWARMYALQALLIFQEIQERTGEAEALAEVGFSHADQGEADHAHAFFTRSLLAAPQQPGVEQMVTTLEKLGADALAQTLLSAPAQD
jgi:hypothetical protein